ncbi:MAG TPA: hypothetical protein VI248_02150 [Kineosporiaceae bacterium]
MNRPHPRPEQPPEPTARPVTRRTLIPLTLAEIRRLLALVHRGEQAIAHGLHWSTWRRSHQSQARRAHFRKRLHRQALMI